MGEGTPPPPIHSTRSKHPWFYTIPKSMLLRGGGGSMMVPFCFLPFNANRKKREDRGWNLGLPSFLRFLLCSFCIAMGGGRLVGGGEGQHKGTFNIAGLTRSLQGGRKGGIVVEWKESGEELVRGLGSCLDGAFSSCSCCVAPSP